MITLPITEKLLKTACFVSALFLTAGLAMRLYCTYKISVASYDLAAYKSQKESLEKEISSLVFKNCELSALLNVEKRAQQLGFIKLEDKMLSINAKDIPQVATLTR
jgi:hypothetical protein